MRKIWFKLRSKIGTFKTFYLNDRIKRTTRLLKKLEAKRDLGLITTILFAINMIPGYKTKPPIEKQFKTLCSKCYRYFYFSPSVSMMKGENIAYTNCEHCNQDHVSVVYPSLETGKTATSYLKNEFEENRNTLIQFAQSIALQLGIKNFNSNNPENDLEKLYQELRSRVN